MLARSESNAVARPAAPADASASAGRANGLLAATLYVTDGSQPASTFVADLDEAAIARVRREALAMRLKHRAPVTAELRYVADPAATALVASLADLASHEVAIVPRPIGGAPPPMTNGRAPHADTTAPVGAPAPSRPPREDVDPFGLDLAFRTQVLPVFEFMFERYWRVDVSGLQHVPAAGSALVVANHSGAVPADAFMLAAALTLRHPARRSLRVLYDKFVDQLPLIGPLYRRLGAVSASLANAELLLRRGELVGLFPEGIAGVEKRCTERYRLRPFKTGTARLSVRTGTPVVPVAIVGAEEAYPVVARLYRAGRLVGLPWIPVTPTFPLCGVAGALPLPTKWSMQFGAPIEPPSRDEGGEEERIASLTAQIRAAIAEGLADLLAKRVGIFL